MTSLHRVWSLQGNASLACPCGAVKCRNFFYAITTLTEK